MSDTASQIFRFILKLALGLFAAIFALSLLVATLVVLALGWLKALITGRKPAHSLLFGRFQQFQQFTPRGVWPGGSGPRGSAPGPTGGQVVDVEAREIREEKRLS
jgi:hypothetical protein